MKRFLGPSKSSPTNTAGTSDLRCASSGREKIRKRPATSSGSAGSFGTDPSTAISAPIEFPSSGTTVPPSRDEAIRQILRDPRLAPIERNLLMILVTLMDDSLRSFVSLSRLSDSVGVSTKTVSRTIDTLCERRLIARVGSGKQTYFRPFPYVSRETKSSAYERHRLIISVEDARILRAEAARRESELTILIGEAQRRHDSAKERSVLTQIEHLSELTARLDQFIRDHANTVRPPEFYEEDANL